MKLRKPGDTVKEMPLAFLPNEEGFQFVGIRKDGGVSDCVVVKNEKGLHEIGGDATYAELRAWRHRVDLARPS